MDSLFPLAFVGADRGSELNASHFCTSHESGSPDGNGLLVDKQQLDAPSVAPPTDGGIPRDMTQYPPALVDADNTSQFKQTQSVPGNREGAVVSS